MSRNLIIIAGALLACLAGFLGGIAGAAVLVLLCFAGGLALADVTTAGAWRQEPGRAMGPIAIFALVAIAGYALGALLGAA